MKKWQYTVEFFENFGNGNFFAGERMKIEIFMEKLKKIIKLPFRAFCVCAISTVCLCTISTGLGRLDQNRHLRKCSSEEIANAT